MNERTYTEDGHVFERDAAGWLVDRDAHVIRIAQRGWRMMQPADALDHVHTGLHVLWVEVDGHRMENVASVRLDLQGGFPDTEIHLIGRVELVYLGENGEELT